MNRQEREELYRRRIDRMRELVKAITGREFDKHEFYMRIPADPEHDADLIISWAADELERLVRGIEVLAERGFMSFEDRADFARKLLEGTE